MLKPCIQPHRRLNRNLIFLRYLLRHCHSECVFEWFLNWAYCTILKIWKVGACIRKWSRSNIRSWVLAVYYYHLIISLTHITSWKLHSQRRWIVLSPQDRCENLLLILTSFCALGISVQKWTVSGSMVRRIMYTLAFLRPCGGWLCMYHGDWRSLYERAFVKLQAVATFLPHHCLEQTSAWSVWLAWRAWPTWKLPHDKMHGVCACDSPGWTAHLLQTS